VTDLTASGTWHDQTEQDFVQLAISWTASSSATLDHYLLCIGTTSGACDVLAAKDIGNVTSVLVPTIPMGRSSAPTSPARWRSEPRTMSR